MRNRNLKSIQYLAPAILPLLLVSGCGNIALQMISGSDSKVQGLNASADGAGFADRCGGKVSELSDPNRVILEQYLKSLPIIVKGESSGVNYEVSLQATVYAKVTGGQSIQEKRVKVTNIVADDDGRFSRPKAEKAASEENSRKTTTSMSSGLLLKLQKSDPNFEGMECAVGFTAKQEEENATEKGVVEFIPGIPLGPNPRASMETYTAELGKSRTFKAMAVIKEGMKEWAAAGTESEITVTFKAITGDFRSISGMPANAPTLSADIAFEVLRTASGGDVAKFGLSKRQVYFINTKTHELVAVLEDSGKISPIDKKPIAPVLAIKDSSLTSQDFESSSQGGQSGQGTQNSQNSQNSQGGQSNQPPQGGSQTPQNSPGAARSSTF